MVLDKRQRGQFRDCKTVSGRDDYQEKIKILRIRRELGVYQPVHAGIVWILRTTDTWHSVIQQ